MLETAGYRVEFLGRSACCGLTWITTGQLDRPARSSARPSRPLHPYVAAGVPIVGLEPSCLSVLRSDAVELLDDPRAVDVAQGVFTLAELLQRTDRWSAPDLTGTTSSYNRTATRRRSSASRRTWRCSSQPVQRSTRLSGCCGLAGNFGVEKGHYEVSVAVAELQLLPAVRNAPPGTIVLADGFSCRTQLLDLADHPAVHLAQLLDR